MAMVIIVQRVNEVCRIKGSDSTPKADLKAWLSGLKSKKRGFNLEQEYRVLNHLQENETTTQRHISTNTGLSLGAVNLLLRKMARKGLIKVEKLNSRTMRYILTPKGMKEKTRLTYQFVRHSYNQIISITSAVENLITTEQSTNGNKEVVLYGPADEIEAILKNTLHGLNIKPAIKRPEEDNFIPEPHHLILTWRHEDEETLTGPGRVYNIMNLI